MRAAVSVGFGKIIFYVVRVAVNGVRIESDPATLSRIMRCAVLLPAVRGFSYAKRNRLLRPLIVKITFGNFRRNSIRAHVKRTKLFIEIVYVVVIYYKTVIATINFVMQSNDKNNFAAVFNGNSNNRIAVMSGYGAYEADCISFTIPYVR